MPESSVARPVLHETNAERLLAHGLPALVIGGALLIAVVWWLTLQLAGVLATTHVERKMADVAQKARDVLAQPLDQAEKRQALAWLARFRDVQRLELRDANGALLWRNYRSISQVRHALPAAGETLLQQRSIDGMPRVLARHLAMVEENGRRLQLVMEADVTNMLASYRQVALLVAKALTTAVLAAILLMGWLLMLRWREQRELARQLRALLEEAAHGEDWREVVNHASAHNAALLRRMLALAEGGRTAAGEDASTATAAQRRHSA